MTRIYVAGPYNADNAVQVFENMRAGIAECATLLRIGFAPFCPWLDYHYILAREPGHRFTLDDFYHYSLAWLGVSDGVLMLVNWESSDGAQREHERARELRIPVFYDLRHLLQHFKDARGRSEQGR